MFPLAFVNASQDWFILQISLASLRVAHMESHWRMTVDASKFNNVLLMIFIHTLNILMSIPLST
jgi:hypothetical protein